MPSDRPPAISSAPLRRALRPPYITKADYNANVDQSSKAGTAVAVVPAKMAGTTASSVPERYEAAEAMELEKAAMYRDQLKAVAVVQEQQNIVNTDGGDMGRHRPGSSGRSDLCPDLHRSHETHGNSWAGKPSPWTTAATKKGPDERRPRPVLQRRHLVPTEVVVPAIGRRGKL